MLDVFAVLLPILLADVVNPVLFAFMVYAVGTERPLMNANAALLGHTTAYLGFGIVLALAFEAIKERLANPEPIDYVFGLLIGVILLWVVWRNQTGKLQTNKEPQMERLTPLKAFGIGAIINIVGLPFALPYFAALDQILKVNLSVTDSVTLLIGYNLVYALPFLVVPLLSLILGENSRPLLARINEKVDRISTYLMPLMLGLVGIVLVIDGLLYFTTGKGLI
jgi:cytochrome c biogenesis protein CcdA